MGRDKIGVKGVLRIVLIDTLACITVLLGGSHKHKVYAQVIGSNKDIESYDAGIKTNKLGNFSIKVTSFEYPSNEFIPIINSSYFKHQSKIFETEIDNLPPSAKYNVKSNNKTKVDIILAEGFSRDNQGQIDEAINNIKKQLEIPSNQLDIKYTNIKVYDGEYTKDWQVSRRRTLSFQTFDQGSIVGEKAKFSSRENGFPGTSGDATLTVDFNEGWSRLEEDVKEGEKVSINASIHSTGLIPKYRDPNNPDHWLPFIGNTNVLIDYAKVYSMSEGNTYSSGYIYRGTGSQSDKYKLSSRYYGDRWISGDRQVFGLTYEGFNIFTAAGLYGSIDGEYSKEVVRDTRVNKPLYKALKDNQITVRPNSKRFIIYSTEGIPLGFQGDDESKFQNTVLSLMGKDTYFIGIGEQSNYFSRVIDALETVEDSNMGMGVSLEELGYSQGEIIAFILSKLQRVNTDCEYFLVDDDILWVTTYDDSERDLPLNFGSTKRIDDSDRVLGNAWGMGLTDLYKQDMRLAEKWRFRHTPEYYDNSDKQVEYHNIWIESPKKKFDKPGQYRVNYKRRDNPLYPNVDIENKFDNYRYWSTDYDSR